MRSCWFSTSRFPISHTSLDRLLELLKCSLQKYFHRSYPVEPSFSDFLASIEEHKLSRTDQLFFTFLKEKAVPLLQGCLPVDIEWSQQLIAKLEYERFILYEEYREFDDRDGVRSSIISVITELPSLLQEK